MSDVIKLFRGAEAKVLSFAEMKDEYDRESSKSDVERFANERMDKMAEVTYKINKTELKDTPWGDVDNNIKKIITSVAQIFAFFLASMLNYFSSTYLLQSERPQSLLK